MDGTIHQKSNAEFPAGLDPCRYCGGIAKWVTENSGENKYLSIIRCSSCGNEGPSCDRSTSLAERVRAWNQRPSFADVAGDEVEPDEGLQRVTATMPLETLRIAYKTVFGAWMATSEEGNELRMELSTARAERRHAITLAQDIWNTLYKFTKREALSKEQHGHVISPLLDRLTAMLRDKPTPAPDPRAMLEQIIEATNAEIKNVAEVPTEHKVSAKEERVVDQLALAWNAFLDLPTEHPDDQAEFRHGIHRLQEKILARLGRRSLHRQKTIGKGPYAEVKR